MNKFLKVILVNAVIIAVGVGLLTAMSWVNPDDETVTTSKKAPKFTAVDSYGKTHKLSDYEGKIVVLEWKNHLCPFVQKHYSSGNMQATQETLTKKGVIWLSIISSAKGKQGHVSAEECNEIVASEKSKATAVLFDEEGIIGKKYGAKTTPHMFVINASGDIVYEGAIDSIRSADPSDIKDATNYVLSAVDNLIKQKPIDPPVTPAYGCSVKYRY
jgi:peroxiredoxin